MQQQPSHEAPGDLGLWTDLYQLTMMQAYLAEPLRGAATFELFFRKLPAERNYFVACGLEDALAFLERVRFDGPALEYLAGLPQFEPWFIDALADFRFTGEVRAVPEGTCVFPNEPVLQVRAPIAEAQLVESYLLNQIHLHTLIASKAARVVAAADGRGLVDFGFRRAHGFDAGRVLARASYLAGFGATSNVIAGRELGIPVSGTMAHSFIEAHNDELAAFRAFARVFPESILLIDTYDTLRGAENVIRLAEELGDEFRIRAVRLDSGDLAELSKQVRQKLDAAGLDGVKIVASGGLDEYSVAELMRAGAPIDGFGVGTHLGVSQDRPYLDCAYKLVAYDGEPRMKLSSGKATLPGAKQVFRFLDDRGEAQRDLIGRADEQPAGGHPLLVKVMDDGRRLDGASPPLQEIRERFQREVDALPPRLRALEPADPPYPVEPTEALEADRERLSRSLRGPG